MPLEYGSIHCHNAPKGSNYCFSFLRELIKPLTVYCIIELQHTSFNILFSMQNIKKKKNENIIFHFDNLQYKSEPSLCVISNFFYHLLLES